ncbi:MULTISPECIES: phage tail protein [Pseudomonas]|uniref:phage tail-collar fiber domain-containing protein n=1 Tax=Pseudomonas TaxID=286 RepID=UPI000CD5480C|nr:MULTISPECIES: phage tail protein [Pseudomonas]RBH53181.1 phage tail protein [Pseudomonas sp. MWU13-2860]
MGASITLAGESLIAQKQGMQQRMVVSRFILANVPGLNPDSPVDRTAGKPPVSQLVGTYDVTQRGFVNPNQVVYSLMLGSNIGDFDWNWIGLETAENVLLAVAYVPLQQKRKNIPPQQLGNNVTRNFMVVFDGAQSLTGITIDASTWQHDFTVRLKGIDERERLSNRDIFGRACFLTTALEVEQLGNTYRVKPGLAYVEGVRVSSNQVQVISPPALPTTVWLDVVLEHQLNDVVARWSVVFGADKADYQDGTGAAHYCIALADLTTSAVIDRRPSEYITEPLLQHLAARNGDYPQLRARSTTKGDVGLGNLPNAVSDDDSTDSSQVLASTKAVSRVRKVLQGAIDKLLDGTTAAGKAKQLLNARTLSISGAGTGSASFDGTANADIAFTLNDSGVQAGTYTKVTVSSKGTVVGAASLVAGDIPALDYSKITTGKPTTLQGYGITNALPLGLTDKRPQLYAPTVGTIYTDGALEIREAQLVGAAQSAFTYAPRIAFHWGFVVAGDLAMSAVGELCWNGQPLFHSGNLNPTTIVPVGAIVAFAMAAVPAGYLKANGAAVSRTAYANLFAYLGTYYGVGDGVSTFNLPDLRGDFIRGWDDGRGLDPHRAIGVRQMGQNAAHTHTASSDVQGDHAHGIWPLSINLSTSTGAGHYSVQPNLGQSSSTAGAHRHNITVDASGGSDPRPNNIAMMYCIKY